MDNDQELKLIRHIEQKQKQMEERAERIIERNTLDFKESFDKELINALAKIKLKNGNSYADYLYDNSNLKDIPVSNVLKNNVNSDEVEQLLATNFKNYAKLKTSAKMVKITKIYFHDILIKLNSSIHVISTTTGFKSQYKACPSDVNFDIININHTNFCNIKSEQENFFCLDLNNTKTYLPVSSCQFEKFETYDNIKEKNTKIKFETICKKVFKILKSNAEKHIKINANFFLSKAKIRSLSMEHILCPFYEIRIYKTGFDKKYLVNANTKICIEI